MEKLKTLQTRIKKRKKDIALILAWSVVIALILIKTYQFFYWENEQFSVYKVPYLHYKGPVFSDLDRVLLLATSFLATLFLSDPKSVVYGFFVSTILSSLIAVIYLFLYIWFVLDLGVLLSTIPFGWEWVLFLAIINVFRFMFPIGIVFCLIGVTVGSLTKMVLRPYS
jgi:hypothetical protein